MKTFWDDVHRIWKPQIETYYTVLSILSSFIKYLHIQRLYVPETVQPSPEHQRLWHLHAIPESNPINIENIMTLSLFTPETLIFFINHPPGSAAMCTQPACWCRLNPQLTHTYCHIGADWMKHDAQLSTFPSFSPLAGQDHLYSLCFVTCNQNTTAMEINMWSFSW